MTRLSPLDYLKHQLSDLKKEKIRVEAEMFDIEARIALYETARKHCPEGIPPDWEPVLDAQGVVKGWLEPEFASRRYA